MQNLDFSGCTQFHAIYSIAFNGRPAAQISNFNFVISINTCIELSETLSLVALERASRPSTGSEDGIFADGSNAQLTNAPYLARVYPWVSMGIHENPFMQTFVSSSSASAAAQFFRSTAFSCPSPFFSLCFLETC